MYNKNKTSYNMNIRHNKNFNFCSISENMAEWYEKASFAGKSFDSVYLIP